MDDWLIVIAGVTLLAGALQVLAVWWTRRHARSRAVSCRDACQYAADLGLKGGACYRECHYLKNNKELR